jgi:hypothetical protein
LPVKKWVVTIRAHGCLHRKWETSPQYTINLFLRKDFLINITEVSLTTYAHAYFLLSSTQIPLRIQNIIIPFSLSRKYIISKFMIFYDSLIRFYWDMLLLTRNDPMREFIPLFKLLMMAATLQSSFRLYKFLHIFKKSIRSK